MRSVIRWTLWQRRWSIFWWSFGVAMLVLFTMAFYPTIHDQAAQLNQSLKLGSSTEALFGGTDFFSPLGYLNSQIMYFTLPLILAILSIGLGTSLIGREESSGSIESLLARPISRGKLITAKALSGISITLIVTLIVSLITILMCKIVNLGVPYGNIAAACFACFMLVITFGALAFLLTATGRGRAAALGIAVVYGFGGYLVSSLASSVEWLKHPALLFPYHYYRTADILAGKFAWSSIAFFAIFTLACGLLAWLSFRRRDLS
jgi:ABC-2 type transport system permease protein